MEDTRRRENSACVTNNNKPLDAQPYAGSMIHQTSLNDALSLNIVVIENCIYALSTLAGKMHTKVPYRCCKLEVTLFNLDQFDHVPKVLRIPNPAHPRANRNL
jgi:hypothetical protein